MRQINWAQQCQNKPERMSEYFSKTVICNECIFCLNDSVNTQNVRIWATELPIKGRQAFIHSPSLTLRCATSKYKVVGPYFFENDTFFVRMVLQHIILIA